MSEPSSTSISEADAPDHWWAWNAESGVFRHRTSGEELRVRGRVDAPEGGGRWPWIRFDYVSEAEGVRYPLLVEVRTQMVTPPPRAAGVTHPIRVWRLDHVRSAALWRDETGRTDAHPSYGLWRRVDEAFWNALTQFRIVKIEGMRVDMPAMSGGWWNGAWRPAFYRRVHSSRVSRDDWFSVPDIRFRFGPTCHEPDLALQDYVPVRLDAQAPRFVPRHVPNPEDRFYTIRQRRVEKESGIEIFARPVTSADGARGGYVKFMFFKGGSVRLYCSMPDYHPRTEQTTFFANSISAYFGDVKIDCGRELIDLLSLDFEFRESIKTQQRLTDPLRRKTHYTLHMFVQSRFLDFILPWQYDSRGHPPSGPSLADLGTLYLNSLSGGVPHIEIASRINLKLAVDPDQDDWLTTFGPA
jgi:hypothetical protein